MLRTPKKTLVLVAFVVTFIATGCSTSSPSPGGNNSSPTGSGPTGTVTVATPPPAVVPTMASQVSTTNEYPIRGTIYESLVGSDPVTRKSDIPLLATSWTHTGDNMHWTFELRQGVQFQRDAGEFTSADVKFTWEYVSRTDSLATDAPFYRDEVASVDTPDPYTVTFNLNHPQNLPAKMDSWVTDMLIMSKSYYDKVGEKEYQQTPVGTGPYQLDSWDPATGMTFSYFDKYWGTPPGSANLNLKFVADDQTRMSMLQAGEADIADIPRVLVSTAQKAGLTVQSPDTPTFSPLLWFGSLYTANMGGMPWADVKVREALNLAIDRDALIKGPFNGYAVNVASTFLGPSGDGYADLDREPYPYDVNKAKQLLSEAGYADGLDITLTLGPVAGISELDTVAQAIVAQWKEVGVNAKIVQTDGTETKAGYRDRKPLPYIFTTREPYDVDPQSEVGIFFSRDGIFGGLDDEISTLADQTGTTALEKRGALYAEIAQKNVDGYWTIPLPALKAVVASNPKTVTGWQGTMEFGFDGWTSLKPVQ